MSEQQPSIYGAGDARPLGERFAARLSELEFTIDSLLQGEPGGWYPVHDSYDGVAGIVVHQGRVGGYVGDVVARAYYGRGPGGDVLGMYDIHFDGAAPRVRWPAGAREVNDIAFLRLSGRRRLVRVLPDFRAALLMGEVLCAATPPGLPSERSSLTASFRSSLDRFINMLIERGPGYFPDL